MELIIMFLLSFMSGINEITNLLKIIDISAEYVEIPIAMSL